MKTIIFTLFLCCFFMGCQKEDLSNEGNHERSKEFQQYLTIAGKKFKPVDFYSDIPIDYNPNDSNYEKETALWKYVLEHITDDHLYFSSDGTVQIHQNAITLASDNSPVLMRTYKIAPEGQEVYFDFVDYLYEPLRYYLGEIGPNYFTVYIKRDNAKLYSKFSSIE